MYLEAGFDLLPFFTGTKEKKQKFNQASHRVFRREHAMIPIFARVERLNTHNKISNTLPQEQAVIQDNVIFTIGFNYEPNKQMPVKIDYVLVTTSSVLERN